MVDRRRLALSLVVLALGLPFLAQVVVHAEPSFNVIVGLGGRVVPNRFAPLWILPSESLVDTAQVRLIQSVGNAWRGEASLVFELPFVLSDSGTAEAVIPIHDPALPLRVQLLSPSGGVLAEREVELRSRKEDEPFAVGVGAFSAPISDRAVLLRPTELPGNPSAYDPARSLWIGRTSATLPADRWDALTRWVMAGGTLVVFTGSDFYLLDAPGLRAVLPIRDPVLAEDDRGARVLAGELRSEATVLLSRGALPWLIARPYGAGTVLLVTSDAASTPPADLGRIAPLVPAARAFSLRDATSALLDAQPTDHPQVWIAVILVSAALAALAAIVARREWRPAMGVALGLVFALLAVSSGFVSNVARVSSDIYLTSTSVRLETSVGFTWTCAGVFCAARSPVLTEVSLASPPFEALPRAFATGSHDLSYVEATARVALEPGQRRVLCAQGSSAALLTARLVGDEELRIHSRLPSVLPDVLLLVDGEAFPLPPIGPNDATAYLGAPLRPSAVHLGSEGAALDQLRAAVARFLPLDHGAWLIAGRVAEMREAGTGPRTKLREVSLLVVEVARD